MNLSIKTYSEKGLVVKGASETQAEAIRSQLGGEVCTQFNANLGGWVFSRKREDKIRSIVSSLMDDSPGKWGILAEQEKEKGNQEKQWRGGVPGRHFDHPVVKPGTARVSVHDYIKSQSAL